MDPLLQLNWNSIRIAKRKALAVQYVVEAEELSKSFGNLVAVNGISFHVLPGECFGILGPNGAGKTTTIRMVYGFSPMTAGSLKVFGLDMTEQWRAIKARIGVCQQENNLDPDLTVEQNLEVFARYFDIPKKAARQRAEELLAFIALSHRRDAKVTELSGGMMRRLVLARALINDPDLLILDEPTTGLDPQSRHQVWERLDALKAKGLSSLLTTHYMDEASRLCDRLVIMDQGKILVQGKPAELINEYVGQNVIEVEEPPRALTAFVHAEDVRHEDLGHRLIIYGEESDRLFQVITGEYCHEGCLLRMATLEDVFLKLTGRGLRE
ncbi:MAG: ATP-binding cassette domain-containing protein [Thermodesulfobacteriota bacterium]|nr:ATP-binding cassette domain-containing protein [Thermodesulfobacteriota bacterium]